MHIHIYALKIYIYIYLFFNAHTHKMVFRGGFFFVYKDKEIKSFLSN